MSQVSPSGERPIGVIGAAVALACSWCWVIGMVFPIFMIMDFGWLGWVVFVVPNVIGAASVGFLLRSRAHAEGFLQQHRHAIRAFTWVTIAFHGFVVLWIGAQLASSAAIASRVPPPFSHGITFLAPVLLTLLLAWRCSQAQALYRVVRVALVTLIASVLCMALAQVTTDSTALTFPPSAGAFPPESVIFALVGTTLGFLTCPFLDVTFLRVRAALGEPKRARSAFAIGFGGPFLALVAMTALYASGISSDYIIAHIGIQSAFTVGFHAWALRRMPGAKRAHAHSFIIVFLLGAVLGFVWRWGAQEFRFGYELMISMYALPFPAYVWVVCVWARRPTPRSLTVCAIAILLAAPLFAVGYLGDRWAFVPLGVAVVLASPLLLMVGRPKDNSGAGSGRRLATS